MSEGTPEREEVYRLCGHITAELKPVWDFLHKLVSRYESLQEDAIMYRAERNKLKATLERVRDELRATPHANDCGTHTGECF